MASPSQTPAKESMTRARTRPEASAHAAAGVGVGGRAAWLVGAGALALGVLVYLVDRAAGTASLLPAGAWSGAAPHFGAVGRWLPSFVHPFAFSLFFAALPPASAARGYRACAAWWAVNVAFEAGQLPQAANAISAALDSAFGAAWPARAVANYFLRGAFDGADLLAATAGALAAACVIRLLVQPKSRARHEDR